MTEISWLFFWWPVAAVGLAGAVLMLVCGTWLLYRLGQRIAGVGRRRPAPRIGLIRGLLALSLSCVGLAIFSLSSTLLINFYAYRALTREEAAAEILCRDQIAPQRFEVLYTPIANDAKGTPRRFILNGEQWLIGADIVKWRPFMHYLGLHTTFKISRLEGRYLAAADQSGRPISAYDIEGGTGRVWRELHQYGVSWPFHYFVDAVYGNAVYQVLEPGKGFRIYVTTSGLIARPVG